MKSTKILTLLSTIALMFPLSVLAGEKNQRHFDLADSVQVNGTLLTAGSYKVAWQEAGPTVQVKFLKNGKIVATAPATLKTNDTQVTQDDVEMQDAGGTQILKEIDFGRQKEALVFGQS